MKKTVSFLVGVVMAFGFMVGSASAETPLSSTINKLVGTPYKYAGTTTRGFDCSGFTSYVFAQFGIDLPHSSRDQDKVGYWVDKNDLRPGDLVFFTTDGTGNVSHVGIYVGDGKFAHSATNEGIVISSMNESYYAKRYVAARRVMWDEVYNQAMTDVGN